MDTGPADTTHEVATLLEVARSVASTIELAPLLGIILDQLKLVADYAGASIGVIEDGTYRFLESRGAGRDQPEAEMIGVRLQIPASMLETFRRGEPVIIDDVRDSGDLARAYREAVGPYLDAPAIRYVRAFLAVPLIHRDRLIGLLTLSSGEPGAYTPANARFAVAIAAYAAAAIENARLYEQTRAAETGLARQIDRLAALTAITHRLLAASELDDLLEVLLESALRLSNTTGAAVGLLEDGGRVIRFAATAGEPKDYQERFGPAVVDETFLEHTAVGRALATRRVVAVEDYTTWGDPARRHALHAAAVGLQVRAQIAAPLLVDGAPIGVLRVHATAPRTFAPADVQLIQALADQAALAIEHTRLLGRGREAAVLEERARLARELHDSVTQSLFSLGMLAQAARQQHERASDRLGPTLDRIAALAQEALAEMRALLVELHPAALAEQGLARALEQIVASARLRGGPAIAYTATTDARPAPEVELALLRIAQEALANALKHAHATEASIALAEEDGRVVLTVSDNGTGFDTAAPAAMPADVPRGGMGLRSMRERAEAAGITLHVSSTPGIGTTIRAAVGAAQR